MPPLFHFIFSKLRFSLDFFTGLEFKLVQLSDITLDHHAVAIDSLVRYDLRRTILMQRLKYKRLFSLNLTNCNENTSKL